MTLFKTLRLNVKIIRALNTCNRNDFMQLVDEVIDSPEVFRKKRYVWNIIRGRDFYKMLAHYVVTQVNEYLETLDDADDSSRHMQKVEQIIRMVMESAKDDSVRRNFAWAVTKQCPLITVDTILYMSAERIRNILKSDTVIVDQAMQPFAMEIADLRKQIVELQRVANSIQEISDL